MIITTCVGCIVPAEAFAIGAFLALVSIKNDHLLICDWWFDTWKVQKCKV